MEELRNGSKEKESDFLGVFFQGLGKTFMLPVALLAFYGGFCWD